VLAGGRSLGVAPAKDRRRGLRPLFRVAAFDGQVSSNGHIRAQLGATSITWEVGVTPAHPTPHPSGRVRPIQAIRPARRPPTRRGKFRWHLDPRQLRPSLQRDDGSGSRLLGRPSANAGYGRCVAERIRREYRSDVDVAEVPPTTTAVIDKTMVNECKALAFAPLASDVMLAVYTNGAVVQPNMTNLRFTKSGAAGAWTKRPYQRGGRQWQRCSQRPRQSIKNDWSLVPVRRPRSTPFAATRLARAIRGGIVCDRHQQLVGDVTCTARVWHGSGVQERRRPVWSHGRDECLGSSSSTPIRPIPFSSAVQRNHVDIVGRGSQLHDRTQSRNFPVRQSSSHQQSDWVDLDRGHDELRRADDLTPPPAETRRLRQCR